MRVVDTRTTYEASHLNTHMRAHVGRILTTANVCAPLRKALTTSQAAVIESKCIFLVVDAVRLYNICTCYVLCCGWIRTSGFFLCCCGSSATLLATLAIDAAAALLCHSRLFLVFFFVGAVHSRVAIIITHDHQVAQQKIYHHGGEERRVRNRISEVGIHRHPCQEGAAHDADEKEHAADEDGAAGQWHRSANAGLHSVHARRRHGEREGAPDRDVNVEIDLGEELQDGSRGGTQHRAAGVHHEEAVGSQRDDLDDEAAENARKHHSGARWEWRTGRLGHHCGHHRGCRRGRCECGDHGDAVRLDQWLVQIHGSLFLGRPHVHLVTRALVRGLVGFHGDIRDEVADSCTDLIGACRC
mmetsp:Transcript_24838/g.69090  ORF Transcript_24838/g.69090 Transcript_24838/m.69090 type:complete len:357 (+) Transcript_24838:1036-2106(+)